MNMDGSAHENKLTKLLDRILLRKVRVGFPSQISSVSLTNTNIWYCLIYASLYISLKLRILAHICSIFEKIKKCICAIPFT